MTNHVAQSLSYHDGDTPLTGVLVRDETHPGPRPAIMIIHGGAGLDDHARGQAHRYAELGYTVLACDMYGDGVAGDRAKIVAQATALRDDPALLVRRARAGLQVLADCPDASDEVAVIGFCFGGMAALTLARSGADLAAAVSIHGTLTTVAPAAPGAISANILVCHGASDPHVPITDVIAFTEEMNRAAADWQLNVYGGAVHGFTHQHAVPGAVPGVAYDQVADERSYAATRAFLTDAFT